MIKNNNTRFDSVGQDFFQTCVLGERKYKNNDLKRFLFVNIK